MRYRSRDADPEPCRPPETAAFNRWTRELRDAAEAAAGFAGAVRLAQTDALQHLLLRFETRDALERFRSGSRFAVLHERGAALAVGLDQVGDGRDVDLDLPSDARASPARRFIVTWLSVLPVLLVVSTAVRHALPALPPPVQVIASSLLLTSLLQWVILPRVQRAARAWMLEEEGRLRV